MYRYFQHERGGLYRVVSGAGPDAGAEYSAPASGWRPSYFYPTFTDLYGSERVEEVTEASHSAGNKRAPQFDYFSSRLTIWRFRPGSSRGERIGISYARDRWTPAVSTRETCERPSSGVRPVEYGDLPEHAK
ncbi:hypothetical protein ACFORO_42620 [Amycolatopsis halotolerans]|uniref:Uncharacterized protein n=1 Tax=Amycolatopsis halotolerans TaxID=330083 RepID=A0ABV7QYB5_9PSEU